MLLLEPSIRRYRRTPHDHDNQPVLQSAGPTGAAVFQDWDDLTTDDPYRYFHGPRAIIPTPTVDVAVWWGGIQRPDGSIEREVCVSELHPDKSLPVGEARQIARAMMSAADSVEAPRVANNLQQRRPAISFTVAGRLLSTPPRR